MRLCQHVLLIPAILASIGPGTPAESHHSWCFVGEQVRMQVGDSVFVVEGNYDFERGDSPQDLVIRYPFPSDTTLGTPELLKSTADTPAGRFPMEIVPGQDGWRWVLSSSWGRKVSVHVTYRQAMLANHATYVLTSARDWGRPLREAVVEVCLPPKAIADISPALPRLVTNERGHVHEGQFRNWLPEEDLVVRLLR